MAVADENEVWAQNVRDNIYLHRCHMLEQGATLVAVIAGILVLLKVGDWTSGQLGDFSRIELWLLFAALACAAAAALTGFLLSNRRIEWKKRRAIQAVCELEDVANRYHPGGRPKEPKHLREVE